MNDFLRDGAAAARWPHKPKVVGSNPTPATTNTRRGRLSFEGESRADIRVHRATEETGDDRPAAPFSFSRPAPARDSASECVSCTGSPGSRAILQ